LFRHYLHLFSLYLLHTNRIQKKGQKSEFKAELQEKAGGKDVFWTYEMLGFVAKVT